MPEQKSALEKYKKAKSTLEKYGEAKQIYDKYLELRKQLGKPRQELINIQEMEKNFKSIGAVKLE